MRTSIVNVAEAAKLRKAEMGSCLNGRQEPDAAGTADLFTEISCGVYQSLWFTAAHSQTPKPKTSPPAHAPQ